MTNCGIACKDFLGDREMNELRFTYGALITDIQDKTIEWSLGNHRGDRQKYFKRSYVRLLTIQELEFVRELVSQHYESLKRGSPRTYYDYINNQDTSS